jgi:prepilin-type N-terminal cleavage/methylation domain-containing protein
MAMRSSTQTIRKPRRSDSFTLVELLMVITIIAILAALILAAGNGVMVKAMRSRGSAEIQAMSTAAEGYKTDNGIYPQSDGNLTTNTYMSSDASASGGEYQLNSALLFQALCGQTNYSAAPISGTKVYMSFKANQVGNPTGNSYVKDPWNNAYGYSSGPVSAAASTNATYNGSGFYDLWSTGGVTETAVSSNNLLTNTWLSNWTQ